MKAALVLLASIYVLCGTGLTQDSALADKIFAVCSPAKGLTTDCATPPRPIYTPDPEYSENARRNGVEGSVVLDVVVGPDGLVREVSVRKHLEDGLDQNSVESVKSWKFRPATMNGTPVSVRIQVQTSFHRYSSPRRH